MSQAPIRRRSTAARCAVRPALDLVEGFAHAEHLDDTLIREVVAVLGPPVALGDPHRLPLFGDRVPDVLRAVHRTAVEVLHVAAAFDAEHLVRLADVDDQLRGHEIGPESDLRGLVAVLEEQVLQQRGVEHDVAVVRDEKVTLRGSSRSIPSQVNEVMLRAMTCSFTTAMTCS